MQTDLILYERLAHWYRVLKPRLADKPILLVETRSADDMDRALDQTGLAVVLIDLGDQPERSLHVLEHAARHSSQPIVLLLDPRGNTLVETYARELGVGEVRTHAVTPPELVALIVRWVRVLERRIESGEWYPGMSRRNPADEMLALATGPSGNT